VTIAMIATHGQLMVALDAVRERPSHPHYDWGLRFLRESSKNAPAAIADPAERRVRRLTCDRCAPLIADIKHGPSGTAG
jgi:hypothetical protein